MDQLYGLDVDYVDWHRFLLCVALPLGAGAAGGLGGFGA